MLSLKLQKGFIQLGIIGVLLLLGAVAVGTKLVSIPDLTFFNISEEAKGVDEANCSGCDGEYLLTWRGGRGYRGEGGGGVCMRKKSAVCRPKTPQTPPRPTPTPIAGECGLCGWPQNIGENVNCQGDLVCKLQPCPGAACIPERPGICVKADGSSKCGFGSPPPRPTAPPGCKYQEVQCFKAPCDPILVCPTTRSSPTPKPGLWFPPGTCSCFGESYLLCAQSEGENTNYAVRCPNGCYVEGGIAGCSSQPSELKSGELCLGDHQCQSGKCIEPGITPNLVNPPSGFRYVCQ